MGFDAFGLPAENAAIKAGGNPRDVTPRNIASIRAADGAARLGDRLGPRARDARAGVLPLDAVALPPLLRARPRVPQGRAGQLVPERPDRARERAGDRRALRALRRARRGEEPRAVVLPHHRRTRTRCSTRWSCSSLARARADDAAQLDRPLGRRRGRLPRRRQLRRRHPRLHDAARHALRRDVLRARARASAGRRARRRDRARGGGARLRAPRRGPLDRRAARRRRRTASSPAATSSTR